MSFQIFQREFLRNRGRGEGGGRGGGRIGFEKEGKSLNAVSRSQQQPGGIEITINLFVFWVKVRTVQTTMIGKRLDCYFATVGI